MNQYSNTANVMGMYGDAQNSKVSYVVSTIDNSFNFIGSIQYNLC